MALVGPELYPIPPIRGGAAELFIDKVARHLTGWRPVVIGVSDPELPRREIRDGVEYRRLPLKGWKRWLYTRYRQYFPIYDRQVAAVLRQIMPEVIHVHNRPLLALALARRLGAATPILLHMHNLYHSLGKRERPAPGTPIAVAGFAACSRFVLEAEKERLALGAAIRRVVYNGVEPESFSSIWDQPAKRRQLREPYGLTDEPVVLFAGKIRESKGVHLVLSAMDRVWEAEPRAALVVVGGTEYGRGRTMRQTPFFRQFSRQLQSPRGRVVLTGFIPPEAMPDAYLMGDIFVGPSQIEEGLGLVFLEAAASGLPVVATRMGGIPEIVQDGQTGELLKQKDDAGELADKIIALLRDPGRRQRLGTRGRDRVLANFSWEQIARKQEQVYDEVAAIGGYHVA